MATSTISYLDIISVVGFRRSSSHDGTNPPSIAGGISAPRPVMTTTLTLEGIVQPDIDFDEYKIIEVDPIQEFVTYPGGTSDFQTVYVTNDGNVPVTILDITASTNNATLVLRFDNSVNYPTIPVNSTGTFEIAYTCEKKGSFSNWIRIQSTVDTGDYKIVTNQFVDNILDFLVSPGTNVNIQLGSYNEVRFINLILIPRLNSIIDTSIVLDFTYSISGSNAWTIYEVGSNSITLKFDSKIVNNENSNYSATLIIEDVSISLNATVNIDKLNNVNLGKWRSAYGKTNSIIGVSYDIIDSVRHITLGVAYIDDKNTGINTFVEGAIQNITADNLGLGAEYLDPPFTYWHTVYRIPLNLINPSKIYYSKDYTVKSQEFDYGVYFGENQAPGSIFIVKSDQYGNVDIFMNNLRIPVEFDVNIEENYSLSEINDLEIELEEIYYAFYYYVPFRIIRLAVPSKGVTELFVGFHNNGSVKTNIVPIPTQP